MPYKLDINEEVNSIGNISKKLKTEPGDVEFPPEVIQESFNIDKLSSKLDEDKYVINENSRNIFEIVKIKDVYNQSKILNIDMITFMSNNDENENNITRKKIKTNIEITPLGFNESKRKKDGITFFGYEKEEAREDEIDISINPIEGENIDDKYYGKHFQIKFNPEDLNYYLRDLGKGFGTFIRINDWVEIKNNFLLNIGENYLIFSVMNNNILNIKLFSVSIGQNSFDFKKENSPITIGRKAENDIYIEDSMLSRIHCTIKNEENKWCLIDGSIDSNENNKKSTNGSWIYANEDSLIYDKMCFKASHYLFECNLIDIDNNRNNNSFSNKKCDLNVI